MQSIPQLAFVIDPHREDIAIKECRKLGIPVVAITDTNCDPDVIDYIIPGNDDAIRAIKLFVGAMADACLEGAAMGKDIEKAVDWLRQKGLAKAAKRADRAAEEGIIILKTSGDNKKAVAVEVKCETDFVARGDKFIEFAKDVVEHAFDNFTNDVEEMLSHSFRGTTMKEAIGEAVAAIGENILLGKAHKAECSEGVVGAYVHSNGKLAALVEVRTTGNEAAALEFSKNVAMQVVATRQYY